MIKEQQARDAAARLYKREFVDVCEELTQWNIDAMTCVMWINEELARRDWQDEPDGDGWYWCEELDADSPPQKIAQHSLGIDANGDDIQPTWKRWTIAGWVSLTGRVCKITERPA